MKPDYVNVLEHRYDDEHGYVKAPCAFSVFDQPIHWVAERQCYMCGERPKRDSTGLCGPCRFGVGWRKRFNVMDAEDGPKPNPIPVAVRASKLRAELAYREYP